MVPHDQRKTVLITGCSSGIGEALAKEFNDNGYHVIATARKLESISHLKDLGMTTLSLDITKPESIAANKVKVEQITNGKLDVLVNNAGIVSRGALVDVTPDHIYSMFNTNVFGHMAVISALLPQLIATKGTIVNMSSASSIIPFPFKGPYAMTKAALNSYGRTLALELSPFDVRVMTCASGWIRSKLEENGTYHVPENSLYKALEGKMKRGIPESQMASAEFAKLLVRELQRGRGWSFGPWRFGSMKEWLWAGTGAASTHWLTLLGESFVQWGVKRVFKWDEVAHILAEEQGSAPTVASS